MRRRGVELGQAHNGQGRMVRRRMVRRRMINGRMINWLTGRFRSGLAQRLARIPQPTAAVKQTFMQRPWIVGGKKAASVKQFQNPAKERCIEIGRDQFLQRCTTRKRYEKGKKRRIMYQKARRGARPLHHDPASFATGQDIAGKAEFSVGQGRDRVRPAQGIKRDDLFAAMPKRPAQQPRAVQPVKQRRDGFCDTFIPGPRGQLVLALAGKRIGNKGQRSDCQSGVGGSRKGPGHVACIAWRRFK